MYGHGPVGACYVRAVERYQARTGQYPASLEALVPRDLLLLDPPVMIRGLGWCYQSATTADGGFYRLGYIYRPVRGVPPEYYSVRVVKSAGALPEGAWACEAELERQQDLARQMYTGP